MNIQQRRVIAWRLISSFILLIDVAIAIYSLIQSILFNTEDKVITIIALIATTLFCLFEIVIILIGGKKVSNLQKIAFTETDAVNNVPLIAVIVGSVFGIGLVALSISVYFIREEINIKIAMLVILSIGVYLLLNCIVYYLYLIFFRKREFNIRNLLK